MEAYVKHRRSLKSKDIKVKDPLPRPPSPSDSSVPSAQLVVASGDDVDRCIAHLGQVLSTAFVRQFDDLSSFLRTSFNQLSQGVTFKIAFNHASSPAPPEDSIADQPYPCPTLTGNCLVPPLADLEGQGRGSLSGGGSPFELQ